MVGKERVETQEGRHPRPPSPEEENGDLVLGKTEPERFQTRESGESGRGRRRAAVMKKESVF